MSRSTWLGVVLALVIAAGLVGLGLLVFNAGVAQGLAESGKLTIAAGPAGGPGAGPWYGYPHAWGFGFGPLGCLVPFLLLLGFFAVMRLMFWGRHSYRPWAGPGRGHRFSHWGGEQGVPPFFDEWHRRAHGGQGPADASKASDE